jgi:hypothetical protein
VARSVWSTSARRAIDGGLPLLSNPNLRASLETVLVYNESLSFINAAGSRAEFVMSPQGDKIMAATVEEMMYFREDRPLSPTAIWSMYETT